LFLKIQKRNVGEKENGSWRRSQSECSSVVGSGLFPISYKDVGERNLNTKKPEPGSDVNLSDAQAHRYGLRPKGKSRKKKQRKKKKEKEAFLRSREEVPSAFRRLKKFEVENDLRLSQKQRVPDLRAAKLLISMV